MINCNYLNSLSVLSLYEGELLGKVNNLFFSNNLKKLEEIEIISENDTKLILPAKNIYKIGKNAITIKNNQCLNIKINSTNLIACPINSKGYTINGEYLGYIKEISITDKFATSKIYLENNKVLEYGDIASCGKNTVIFNCKENKINIKKFEPVIQNEFVKNDNSEVVAVSEKEVKQEKPKLKEISDTFLLGRKCTKDIINFNNEILIKANTVINKKNLKEIKKYNKLRELMLFCK